MTPFIVRAFQPGRIDVAYFADCVTIGVLFFHGERAPPLHYAIDDYTVYAMPSPNRHANLRGLASIQYVTDLADRLQDALAPAGWQFERVEQTMKECGRLGGRPRAVSDEQLDQIKVELRTAGQNEIARKYGLRPSTLSNILRRDRENQERRPHA